MLVYNILQADDLTLNSEDIPVDWAITTDRRYFQHANVIVFHLPGLYHLLENDLEKPEGQVWISWYLESEKQSPWIEDPKIRDIFDLWMCYQEDAGKEHPLVLLCKDVYSFDKKVHAKIL